MEGDLSPRYTPPQSPAPDVEAAERQVRRVEAANASAAIGSNPYALQSGEPLHAFDGEAHVALGPAPPGSPIPSYWRDLLLEAESQLRAARSLEHWPVLGDQGDPERPWADADPPEARERLSATREFSRLEYARRDISGAGTSFLPAGGVPLYVAEAFAVAARSRAPLYEALQGRRRPHPGSLKIQTPRLASGAAVNVQTAENATVAEVDPTSALADVPTGSLAGNIDLSRQLYDFSNPGSDEWLSAELGAAYAATLESQLISGSGSAGQLQGFRLVPGATAVTATNASATAVTNYSQIGNRVQQVAQASGVRPDTLVLAPRLAEFIRGKIGYPLDWFGLTLVESPSIPANLGAGTNQDLVLAFNSAEVLLYERPVAFKVYPEIGSSTLTVRFSALGYAALLASRQPTSVGISTGTEWTPPTF
jgi:hypothetical protein